jgi:drug/metabolite transporter (DMT)-like permease
MSEQTPDSPSSFVWVALTVVYVIWGSTYLAIHFVVQTMPPMISGGVRFVMAAIVLGTAMTARHGLGVLRVSRRRLLTAAIAGLLLLTGGNGMVGIAEQHISSGLAALLVASVPLWLVIFRWGSGDRPAFATIAGVLVGFGGLALLTLTRGGGTGSALGIAVVLAASLSWSIGSFVSARLPMPANPFVASVYEMAVGGLALLVLGFARGETVKIGAISTASWLGLAYLILFGSLLGFTSYVWLLGAAPISLVGTYAYVNPAVAVLLGVLFAAERATWTILLGGLVIVVGVGLVVSTERRPRPVPSAPAPDTAPAPQAAEACPAAHRAPASGAPVRDQPRER